jgi:hypothetical protein
MEHFAKWDDLVCKEENIRQGGELLKNWLILVNKERFFVKFVKLTE